MREEDPVGEGQEVPVMVGDEGPSWGQKRSQRQEGEEDEGGELGGTGSKGWEEVLKHRPIRSGDGG